MSKKAPVRLCLNMIVKNEEHVIKDCLANMTPLVDAFVISDTGSTDRTVSIMEEFISTSGKPGIVTRDSWRNFGANRTVALRHAEIFIAKQIGLIEDTPLSPSDYQRIKEQGEWYICFTDADNTLQFPSSFDKHTLTHDEYRIENRRGGLSYSYIFALRYDPFGIRRWKWREPLHEHIAAIGPWRPTQESIPEFIMNSGHTGARSRDPLCYEKDALVFKGKILKAQVKGLVEPRRAWFYYAQSLKDACRYKDAIAAYTKTISLGGWVQEVYISLLECGRLTKDHLKKKEKASEYFMRAMDLLPQRFEASYELAEMARINKHFYLGYLIARDYLGKDYPRDSLFIDVAASTWKMYDVAAVCAFYIGRMKECREYSEKALTYLPESDSNTKRIRNNLSYC